MITSNTLKEWKALFEKLSKAPWNFIKGSFSGGGGHVLWAGPPDGDWRNDPLVISHLFHENDEHDFEFMAKAREGWPAAVAEIERLSILLANTEIEKANAEQLCENWIGELEALKARPARSLLDEEIDSILKDNEWLNVENAQLENEAERLRQDVESLKGRLDEHLDERLALERLQKAYDWLCDRTGIQGHALPVDEQVPIPMRLTCPECGELHLDQGEFATKPHHTHACQECGCVWRPAVVPTVGVRFLPGFKNT